MFDRRLSARGATCSVDGPHFFCVCNVSYSRLPLVRTRIRNRCTYIRTYVRTYVHTYVRTWFVQVYHHGIHNNCDITLLWYSTSTMVRKNGTMVPWYVHVYVHISVHMWSVEYRLLWPTVNGLCTASVRYHVYHGTDVFYADNAECLYFKSFLR